MQECTHRIRAPHFAQDLYGKRREIVRDLDKLWHWRIGEDVPATARAVIDVIDALAGDLRRHLMALDITSVAIRNAEHLGLFSAELDRLNELPTAGLPAEYRTHKATTIGGIYDFRELVGQTTIVSDRPVPEPPPRDWPESPELHEFIECQEPHWENRCLDNMLQLTGMDMCSLTAETSEGGLLEILKKLAEAEKAGATVYWQQFKQDGATALEFDYLFQKGQIKYRYEHLPGEDSTKGPRVDAEHCAVALSGKAKEAKI